MSEDLVDGQSPAPASVGRRVAARLVDGLLWALPTAIALNPSVGENSPGAQARSSGWSVVIYVAALVYEVVLTWRFGQTIGKRLLRVRVEDVVTETPPTLLQSVARVVVVTALPIALIGNRLAAETAALLDAACGLVLLASVLVRPDHRGLHDLAARTRVVPADPSATGS